MVLVRLVARSRPKVDVAAGRMATRQLAEADPIVALKGRSLGLACDFEIPELSAYIVYSMFLNNGSLICLTIPKVPSTPVLLDPFKEEEEEETDRNHASLQMKLPERSPKPVCLFFLNRPLMGQP